MPGKEFGGRVGLDADGLSEALLFVVAPVVVYDGKIAVNMFRTHGIGDLNIQVACVSIPLGYVPVLVWNIAGADAVYEC